MSKVEVKVIPADQDIEPTTVIPKALLVDKSSVRLFTGNKFFGTGSESAYLCRPVPACGCLLPEFDNKRLEINASLVL